MTKGRSPITPCGRSGAGAGSGGAVKGSPSGKGTVIISTARADDRKQAIRGSKVILIGPGPSTQRRSEKTDAQGNATFRNLEPGSYTFKHELPDSFLVSMAHSSEVSVAENGHALAGAKAFATGTLTVRVVDTLTKALIPGAVASTTAAPQAIVWDPQRGGEQSFAQVLSGRYDLTASADPAKYEALLNGRAPAGSASVLGGGTGVATVELMPRTWIRVTVYDTLGKKTLGKATVRLQPSRDAALHTSPPSDGVNALEFGFAKSSSTAAVLDIVVDDGDLYEVLGVDAA